MKKIQNIALTLALALFATVAFSQIKVVAPNGDVKIGTTSVNPLEKLDVDGAIRVGTTSNTNAGTIRYNGSDLEGYVGGAWVSLTATGGGGSSVWSQSGSNAYYNAGNVGIGTATPAEALHVVGNGRVDGANFQIGADAGTSRAKLEIGAGRTSDGQASFELIADAANYPDWGFRFLRYPNGFTNIDHRGGSNVVFNLQDNAGAFYFSGGGTAKFFVTPTKIQSSVDAFKPGGGSWTAISDRRTKDSVRDFQYGLDDVLKIRPVYYTYNGKADTPTDQEFVGVIAQEIQEVAPFMVKPFTHEDVNKTVVEEYLSVDDTAIKYMLINAVKQQQKMIEYKDEQINELADRLERVEALLEDLAMGSTSTQNVELHGQDAELAQNNPNPFDGSTSISYKLTDSAQEASLNIFDLNGKILKTIQIDNTNKAGAVTIDTHNMPNGTYSYNLVIDGQIVDSKKMILSK